MFKFSNVHMFKCSNVQCSYDPMFKYWNFQMFKCSNIHIFQYSHMLRFHENSSNHPKDFTSLFLGENSFLVFHLAFISYEKLFECTAMHLATWKPVFTGGCKQRVNCYQIARHVSPDTIQTSPNIRFLGGLVFEKYF